MDHTLYRPLTPIESGSHIDLARPVSILASGEANYFDFEQIPIFNTSVENFSRQYSAAHSSILAPKERSSIAPSSIFAPSGLEFLENDKLSNAKQSRDNAENNINIFNPYIHYISNNDKPFMIDFSTQFDEVAEKFNVYSQKYRSGAKVTISDIVGP